MGKYRGEQDYFDKGLPALLENEKHNVHTTVPKNFDSPVRVSISLGTTLQPPTIAPAPDMAAPAVVPSENPGTSPTVTPRRVLTPPEHLTAQSPDSSEKSDESVDPIAPLRRSERFKIRTKTDTKTSNSSKQQDNNYGKRNQANEHPSAKEKKLIILLTSAISTASNASGCNLYNEQAHNKVDLTYRNNALILMQLKMTHGGTSELSEKTSLVEIAAWETAFLQTCT